MKATRRERREKESRWSEAAFQPAVTLMTPFITMCRLTSWQRHAAPDGGEGCGITPTLCLSFVEEEDEEEEECGSVRRKFAAGVEEVEERRKWRRPAAQLDWLLQRERVAALPFVLVPLTGGWSQLWPDLVSGREKKNWRLRGVMPIYMISIKNSNKKIKINKSQQGERSSGSQGLFSYLLKSHNLFSPLFE